MAQRLLRIGTRGSRLALEQARRVAEALPGPSELVVIRTAGDRDQSSALSQQGGIGLFTREIQEALLDYRIDLAVHSLKDLPIAHPAGLCLAAVLPRDEAGDLLLARPGAVVTMGNQIRLPLMAGARVGTSSLRRRALLLAVRPDLQVSPIRGNIPTRIRKVIDGAFDATLLSRAGPVRLGLAVAPLSAFDLNPVRWPGAPGQGVIAVEARENDMEAVERAGATDDAATRALIGVERALHRIDGGGCHAPFGAFAWTDPQGGAVSVCAPNSLGVLHQRVFRAMTVRAAGTLAEAWLMSARGDDPAETTPEWLVRPATPWAAPGL
jgi:hydroxymethylbilane synthase